MVTFSADSKQLKHYLGLVSNFASGKSDMFALAKVKLDTNTKRGQIKLTSSNGSQHMSVKFDSFVKEDISILLDQKMLIAILGKVKQDTDIDFFLREKEGTEGSECSVIEIEIEKGFISMPIASAEDYPSFPELENSSSFDLKVDTLQKGIKNTLFAASSEISKQILTGVNIKNTVIDSENAIKFAATDSHRLAIASVLINNPVADFEVTVPAIALTELLKIVENYSSENLVTISASETLIKFSIGDYVLISSLVNGDYPNYEQLLPSKFDVNVSCDRVHLIDALELVQIAAQKSQVAILELNQSGEVLNLKTQAHEDSSRILKEVDAQYSVPELFEIGFNIKYLLSGLKSIDSKQIIIQANQPHTPVIVIPVDCEIATEYLIMPVQIRH